MLEYEKFEKMMNSYKSMKVKEENLNKALYDMSADFGGYYFQEFHELFLDMMAELVKDKNEWISYYIYETNWGEDWKEGNVTRENGTDIPLKTLRDLYNIIKEEYETEREICKIDS